MAADDARGPQKWSPRPERSSWDDARRERESKLKNRRQARAMQEFIGPVPPGHDLSASELNRVAIGWLEDTLGPDTPCPLCANPNWDVSPPISIALLGEGWMLPLIPITCDYCGNTMFINAVVAGLAPYPSES